MKNLALLFLLTIFTLFAKAQKWDEKKSGKYIKNDSKNLYTGRWIANETANEIEFSISTQKKQIKGKELNYYTDAILIKIIKCIYKGEDVSNKVNDPILLPSGDSYRYSSMFLKDPITKDEIVIKLYYVDKKTLKLKVNTLYSGSSTIFPKGDTILKRKSK